MLPVRDEFTAERERALACARVLGLGSALIRIGRVIALLNATPGGLMALGMLRVEALAIGTAALALASWGAAEWLAARVRLDIRLFKDVAAGRLAWKSLDEVLVVAPRPFMARAAGALRLLRRLAATTVVLLGLAVLQLLALVS